MRLIADSGSSNTSWVVLSQTQEPFRFYSEGVNPVLMDAGEIYKKLFLPFQEIETNSIFEVHFYGAGIINDDKKKVVSQALTRFFPQAEMNIESDLLAAARAGLGNKEGIACILGTGANSCLYDGEKIVEHISPLGYILGDEGSGAVMGRKLVGDYLKNVMPTELKVKFREKYPYSAAEYIDEVYRGSMPNKFLAGLSEFLWENIETGYCSQFIYDEFDAFVRRNIMGYTDYTSQTISFVGSIAFYFKKILMEVLANHQLMTGEIIKDPIGKLVDFHMF